MNSFMRWVGGKKSLRQLIVSKFPEHKTYVEVFGGAAWVLFHKEKSASEIYNDITKDLVNLFMQVKYHSDALQTELRYMLPSRDLFKKQKGHTPLTELQRAARFYWLIKYSYASKGGTFNSSAEHAQPSINNSLDQIGEVADRLDKVTIENLDFAECIEKYDREGTFFYLDPPYFKCQDYNFVGNKFTIENHVQLAEILKQVKGKWLLSYNDVPQIVELYSNNGYKIDHFERTNNLSKIKNNPYRELLIRNYK